MHSSAAFQILHTAASLQNAAIQKTGSSIHRTYVCNQNQFLQTYFYTHRSPCLPVHPLTQIHVCRRVEKQHTDQGFQTDEKTPA